MPQRNQQAMAVILALVSLMIAGKSHGGVMGSSVISNGSIGTIFLVESDNVSPVVINSLSTVSGRPTGTILGIAKVNGTDDGFFNLGVFGQKVHDNEARFQFSSTITNSSAIDQIYSMDFLIDAGQLETTVYEVPPDTGEFQEAGYEIAIRFNGNTLFQSSALMRQVGVPNTFESVVSLTLGGTSLGGVLTNPDTEAPDRFLFDWDAFSDTLNLGLLGAGQSGLLEYDVRTYVRAEFAGDGGATRSRFGDPFDVSGDGGFSSIGGTDTITGRPAEGAVPEPGTLAIFATGCLGIVWTRRRIRLTSTK